LISDRQETSDYGQSSEVKKNYLSKKRDFALAGSGDSRHNDSFITKLNSDDRINGQNVAEKINDLLSNYSEKYNPNKASGEYLVNGVLVAWENTIPKPYKFRINENTPSIRPITEQHYCTGNNAAETLANYLLKKRNYSQLSWEIAANYVIAIMKEIGKGTDSVGSLEDYGLDIVVFLDSGKVCECSNLRQDAASISVDFKQLEGVVPNFEIYDIESINYRREYKWMRKKLKR
jgi:hypothetical protein